MFRTKLVDFVMNFISNPEFLIILSVVENCLVDGLFSKLINNLNLVEVYKGAI